MGDKLLMGMPQAHHDEMILVDPDLHLAQLLSRSLGTTISRDQVKTVIRNHWSKLEVLAHAVHHQELMQES